MKKFNVHDSFNLSQINKEVLADWQRENLFEQTLREREGAPSFVFFEGPPSANGKPGIHHVMARSIKDIFCRYKTMRGFHVKRRAGWDTHGLPVELGVEKSLGITKEDIGKKISVDDYNSACRREVMKYTREWEDLTSKMGYWVDMENAYITYDNPLYRIGMVASPSDLRQRPPLQRLHNSALLSRRRHRSKLPRAQSGRLLPRREGHHLHRAVPHHRPQRCNDRLG